MVGTYPSAPGVVQCPVFLEDLWGGVDSRTKCKYLLVSRDSRHREYRDSGAQKSTKSRQDSGEVRRLVTESLQYLE